VLEKTISIMFAFHYQMGIVDADRDDAVRVAC